MTFKPINVPHTAATALIERAYRESGADQYIRELLQNAIEAGAKRIEIGPEWQASERLRVRRLMFADNGKGMTAEQMERYLGQLGEGGKATGGPHENFGIGAKTSTLPWNLVGVVIISYTPEYPDGAMIWLAKDEDTGLYGMRELSESGERVVSPWDDTEGASSIDWTLVAPEWVRVVSGTVVVLLGNQDNPNTIWGKTGTGYQWRISEYLVDRYWSFPEGVSVSIIEANGKDPRRLPFTQEEAMRSDAEIRFERRKPKLSSQTLTEDNVAAHGKMDMRDGSVVRWFLRQLPQGQKDWGRPASGRQAFIAALYKDELYGKSRQGQTYRAWGVSSAEVQKNLTIVVEPKKLQDDEGVFPSQARAVLMCMRKGELVDLPMDQWREEFANNLPQPIMEAIARAQKLAETDKRDERLMALDRELADRYKDQTDLKAALMRAQAGGQLRMYPETRMVPPITPGPEPRPPGPERPKRRLQPNSSSTVGELPAVEDESKGTAIPAFNWVDAAEMGQEPDEKTGVIDAKCGARWTPPCAANRRGLIEANRDFVPFQLLVKQMQKRWPESYADVVREAVETEVKTSILAKVAEFHGRLSKIWKAPRVRELMASPEFLSLMMVGFASEQEVIRARLEETIGKAKKASEPAAA